MIRFAIAFLQFIVVFFPLSIFSQSSPLKLVVLGVAQDAGYPQAGCQKECCKPAWENPALRRYTSSLGIIDREKGKTWLFDATPDIKYQLYDLNKVARLSPDHLPNGIFLTHGHVGHYTGIMHLGREVIGSKGVPVYAMPRMRTYLETNGPWSQLVSLKNIKIIPLSEGFTFDIDQAFQVVPLKVPHRDEYTETVGYKILGPQKTVLFIPDIDKWQKWEVNIIELIKTVDLAFLDATFFRNGEVQGRDMSEIPHPFVEESMHLFESLPASEKDKIYFIHFNHTNPLNQEQSKEYQEVNHKGFHVAKQGDVIGI